MDEKMKDMIELLVRELDLAFYHLRRLHEELSSGDCEDLENYEERLNKIRSLLESSGTAD